MSASTKIVIHINAERERRGLRSDHDGGTNPLEARGSVTLLAG